MTNRSNFFWTGGYAEIGKFHYVALIIGKHLQSVTLDVVDCDSIGRAVHCLTMVGDRHIASGKADGLGLGDAIDITDGMVHKRPGGK